nr:hypothetical protein [Bacilli bacterium]
MEALFELVLGLFALAVVAMIFYPFLAVLLIINRKITAFLLPKLRQEKHPSSFFEPGITPMSKNNHWQNHQ